MSFAEITKTGHCTATVPVCCTYSLPSEGVNGFQVLGILVAHRALAYAATAQAIKTLPLDSQVIDEDAITT